MKEPIDYHRFVLPPESTLHRAIEVMTLSDMDIVIIADKSQRLKGILVDSDIRKAILQKRDLNTEIRVVMNTKPAVLPHNTSYDNIAQFIRSSGHANIPLVDAKNRIRGLAQASQYLPPIAELSNWVVLMAGGQGSRLYPLTASQPKPLLHVGNRPILETIIAQFARMGLRRFILALNHHAPKIRSHFGDGRASGIQIRYVEEPRPLGTAGPLSLIGREFSAPIIVMNGDLLTTVDIKALLRFHSNEGSLATVCVREYDFQIPYGVVRMDDSHLIEIVEKPSHRSFINAGIYVLDPKVLAWVPKGRCFDMPALLEKVCKRQPGAVSCFPIREYWIDIGHIQDLVRAQNEYGKYFP